MLNSSFKTVLGGLVIAFFSLTLLASCDLDPGATTKPPTLFGTWQSTRTWEADGQVLGTEVNTLTFTATRYISHYAEYLSDGTLDNWWENSGTWELDESQSTITRIWEHDHDDDPDTLVRAERVSKDYVWADEVLFIHHWGDEHPTSGFDRYKSVPNPLPSPPVGVWRFADDEGDQVYIITVNGDGTIRFDHPRPDRTFMITANLEHDQNNYFLVLTGASATNTPTGGSPEPVPNFRADSYPRVAYAPTDKSPDEMLVSYFWDEREGRFYSQYGNYWRKFQRQ